MPAKEKTGKPADYKRTNCTRADPVVSVRMSRDLKAKLEARRKPHKYYGFESTSELMRRVLIEYVERTKPTPKKERARF